MTKEEYREWCDSCEFIQDNLQFYSMEDFIDNKKEIKYIYQRMDRKGQKLYQWYINSKNYITYSQKYYIWDIINGNIPIEKERK